MEKNIRVLAINDLSCVGRCSLTAALPILSSTGLSVTVLPTAVLSTQTGGLDRWTFLDLTAEIKRILIHWKSLGLKFDAIYAGYLASIEQVDIVRGIKKDFLEKDGKFFLDPVMGDNGELYKGFDALYPAAMKALLKEADYAFPNVTEACLLSGKKFQKFTHNDYSDMLKSLGTACENVVITGLTLDGGLMGTGTLENGKIGFSFAPGEQGVFHGAGDVLSSAATAAVLKGKSFSDAIEIAAEFVQRAIARTVKCGTDTRFGTMFESEIPWLIKQL